MTLNQINGVLRAIVPAALAYAVGKGWIPQDQVTEITAAVVTITSAIWSIISNVEGKPTNG